jgi:hypothetical protein
MMTGFGQFRRIEMGGMFTVMKVRKGLVADDDPGPYRNPEGTVAHELKGAAGEPSRQSGNPPRAGVDGGKGAPQDKAA